MASGVKPGMRLKREEAALVLLLFLALAYPAWARGGTRPEWQAPMPVLGALVLAGAVWLPGRRRGASEAAGRAAARRVVRDPIFYLGAAFLSLLAVQWWNAGRTLVFDWTRWQWVYSAPRFPRLPSAIDRGEARQMLCWFFPAWSVALALRSGALGADALRTLFRGLAANAVLLALFGLAQYASGTRAIYWTQPIEGHFFASFGYPAHAGAYFLLMLGLCLGLVFDGLFSRAHRAGAGALAAQLAAAVLCLAGASLSLALAPLILSWGLAAGAGLWAALWGWRRLSGAGRVRLAVGLAAAAALAVCLLAALYRLGPERMRGELWELALPGPRMLAAKYRERAVLVRAAWAVWREQPWFGAGGWGFRYLLALHVPPRLWSTFQPGDANVHNDALQFLAEFGIVGAGLLAAAALALLAAAWRARAWRKPLALPPLAAAALVAGYSCMDLPFRCPAVLYAWLTVIAAAPGFVIRNPSNPNQGAPHES